MDELKERRKRLWTGRIAAMAAGFGLGMAVLILPIWWNRVKTLDKFNDDFAAFYTAARLDLASLYNLDRQHAVQRQFVTEPERLANYYYPPFFAVALKPLALLSYRHAFATVSIMNLIFLAFSLRILIRKLKLDKLQIYWLLLVASTNFGVYASLLRGQTAFISLILFVVYVMAVIDSEDPVICQAQPSVKYRAGIWAAFLCFKPPLAVVPLIVLVTKRKYKSLIAFLITLTALGGISLAAVGWDGIEAYLDISKRVGTDTGYMDYAGLHDNIRAVIYYFLTSSDTIRTLIWAAASTVLLWLVIFYAKRPGWDSKAWTIILVSALLISPYLHGTDLTLLVVPTAFFLKWIKDDMSPYIVLLLTTPGILLTLRVAPVTFPPLAPIVLVVFLIWIIRKENSAGSIDSTEVMPETS